MTLIELLKITNDSTPVIVRTRMYGLTDKPNKNTDKQSQHNVL